MTIIHNEYEKYQSYHHGRPKNLVQHKKSYHCINGH